jgi:4-hydroxybenzoate polyprenyltransferase
MASWLRLIRWQNLLIIFLTQLLVWWCLVLPQNPVILTLFHFLLLAMSTVFIAAAGYIINDYFDIKIDQLNRPGKVVVGMVIPGKTAIIAHIVFNILGIGMAGYVAFYARHFEWLVLQAGCIALLWTYSTTYKRQYITGNITISLLTALTVIALYAYEPALQQLAKYPFQPGAITSSLPVWILGVYAFFAFMLTWIREIVKDMEDMEGDAAGGCTTMPIKHGLAFAARFATALALLAITPLLLSCFVLYFHGYTLLSFYVLALLTVPVAFWIRMLWRGPASPAHYHRCSQVLKLIMLSGICSLLIYKFQ